MCNTRDPGAKSSALGVPSLFDRENRLDKCILKNIVSQITVADPVKNITEKGMFVPGKQNFKRTIVTFGKRDDQLLVGHRQKNSHYQNYLNINLKPVE